MIKLAQVTVCSEINTKHIKTMWTESKFFIVNLVVLIVTGRV